MNNLFTNARTKKVMTFDEVCAKVPSGWRDILNEGFSEMFALGWDGSMFQIKEKFARLRIYLDENATSEIRSVVDKMSINTNQVCSVCGSQKTKTSAGWVLHYCDDHFPVDKPELGEQHKRMLGFCD